MDFNTFPAQWEWVALILGGVAFVMAIPSLFQMIWGAPKITIRFGEHDIKNVKYLQCEIFNEPITKGVLNFLRVRRESAQDVVALFNLQELGSGTIILPDEMAMLKTDAGVFAYRISLPPSRFPAIFGILAFERDTGEAQVYKENGKQLIPAGAYRVNVAVNVGGKGFLAEGALMVRDSIPFLYWIKS